jgi:hypothetical protein
LCGKASRELSPYPDQMIHIDQRKRKLSDRRKS